MDRYRELIKENIDFDLLLTEHPYDADTLEGYVELMVEVCCSRRDFIRIAGEEMPTGVVKSRFLKLGHEHIAYVLDSLSQNTTLVKNIKAYTLAALYNAPTTISQAAPNADITRAEVAAILYRLLTPEAKAAYGTSINRFEDVPAGAWYGTAVSTLCNMGVITGYQALKID